MILFPSYSYICRNICRTHRVSFKRGTAVLRNSDDQSWVGYSQIPLEVVILSTCPLDRPCPCWQVCQHTDRDWAYSQNAIFFIRIKAKATWPTGQIENVLRECGLTASMCCSSRRSRPRIMLFSTFLLGIHWPEVWISPIPVQNWRQGVPAYHGGPT